MLKKQNKKSQVPDNITFLNHISLQLVQRAVEWDLLGAPSSQLTFMNTAPKQASHTIRRPPESLIHWCFQNCGFLPGKVVLDPELWLGCIFRMPFFAILDEGPFGYTRPHLTTATNSFKFRTNSISTHELFLLACRLWCSKACF